MNNLSGLKKKDYKKDLGLDFWIVGGDWCGREAVRGKKNKEETL